MNKNPPTLVEILSRNAQIYEDRPFLQWKLDTPQTYREVYDLTSRLAGGLASLGVQPKDPVLLFIPNSLEVVHSWFACNFIGAFEVPVNTFLRGSFLKHIIDDSQAEVMIIEASLIRHLAAIEQPKHLRKIIVIGD